MGQKLSNTLSLNSYSVGTNYFDEVDDTDFESDSDDEDNNNGFILNGVYVPIEILLKILVLVDAKSLNRSCGYVCRSWRRLLKSNVWKMKAQLQFPFTIKRDLPWKLYMKICVRNPFDKNFLRNSFGEEEFNEWLLENNGGDEWVVEDPPVGCEALPIDEDIPPGVNSCFATSYDSCSKSQEIDLVLSSGLSMDILYMLKPPIYICEWFAGRFDCGSIYRLNVSLYDSKRNFVEEFDREFVIEQWLGGVWNKIEHTFENYPPNVRYIYFHHEGNDTQFWKGHYGSKMTGATVKLSSVCIKQ